MLSNQAGRGSFENMPRFSDACSSQDEVSDEGYTSDRYLRTSMYHPVYGCGMFSMQKGNAVMLESAASRPELSIIATSEKCKDIVQALLHPCSSCTYPSALGIVPRLSLPTRRLADARGLVDPKMRRRDQAPGVLGNRDCTGS